MNIVLLGDSITDMERNKEQDGIYSGYGFGYPFLLAGSLGEQYADRIRLYDRGISGNRVVDLYARVKSDCWELKPDVVSILVGINDVWHEFFPGRRPNGVELDRYEKVYEMLIADTLRVLPDVKIMLMEPFVLHGSCTDGQFERFCQIKDYAKAVKRLAEKYHLTFVPLQETFDQMAKVNAPSVYLEDGIHPTPAGARIIAEKWMEGFYQTVKGTVFSKEC